MKALNTKKKMHWQCILVLLAISVLLSSPLFYKGFFIAHDINCHMFKTVGTVKALLDGQIPPLVGPDLANGFGYAWNIFYSPLSAYIPALFKIFLPTFIGSMKLFIFLTIFISGITMFYFALDVTRSKNLALLAAIFYITAPYRLQDIYIRGAMGEALAFVFIPIFFHGLFSLLSEDGRKDHYIAIGFSGLLLAHNISALMCATVAVVYILAHFRQLSNTKVIKSFIINGLFIIGLSLFYLVPLLEHRFLGNYEVFLPDRMGSLASLAGQGLYPHQMLFQMFNKRELNFSLGLQLVLPLLFIPMIYKQLLTNKNMMVLLLLGLGSVFLMSFVFPWTSMPSIFSFVQFPWRYLSLAVFFLSIPCSYIIGCLYRELELRHFVPIILFVFIYISPILALTANDSKIFDQDYMKVDLITEQSRYSQGSAFFEYMPVKAKADISYLATREDRVIVTEGEAEIGNEVKRGSNLRFDITTKRDTQVELPYLYYLGWYVSLESDQVTSETSGITRLKAFESEKGFVSFVIPAKTEGSVRVSFQGTIRTRAAYVGSVVALIIFIWFLYRKRENSKHYCSG